jgi:hypothetical protein
MTQAALAMTQRVFSAREPCVRKTLPLKDLRKRMREFLAEKTGRCGDSSMEKEFFRVFYVFRGRI